MEFPSVSDDDRRRLLEPGEGRLRVLLDTDTYNEIDDQFVLVHALLSPDRIDLEAIHAAPFHNNRSEGPADGVHKSYEEIGRLLDRLGLDERERVFLGAERYLPKRSEGVDNAASRDLIERAHAEDGPLYVAAIGAITNVASAILLDPDIVKKVVVVWLGGQPYHWPTAQEFNLRQDVPAAQVVFDSGVAVVQIPCAGVASHLLTTVPELDTFVRPHGAIGSYLADIFAAYRKDRFARSKEVWDLSAIAWLIDASWVPSVLVLSPILTDQVTYSFNPARHIVRVATSCRRDPIFGDLFLKLEKLASGSLKPAWSAQNGRAA